MPKALTTAIANVGLSGIDAEVLRYLVREPLGIREEAFPSILASRTKATQDECQAAASRLLARGYITAREEEGTCRYVANTAALPLDRAALAEVASLARPNALEVLGPPHGESAMRSLSEIVVNVRRPIYIALDMTGHEVFKDLKKRAEQGFHTTFLAPHKRAVAKDLEDHWEDVFHAWARWLKSLGPAVRKNVALLLTPRHYSHLSTSLATDDFVRFDVYWTQDHTTRNGEMVRASKGTSLYDLVRAEYEDAYATADPYWRAGLGRWALAKLERWFVPVGVVGALVAITYWGVNEATRTQKIFFSLSLSLVADVVGMFVLKRAWWQRKKSIS